jgi:hypothetical protein
MTIRRRGTWSAAYLLVGTAVAAGLTCIATSADYARSFRLREGPLPFEYPLAALISFVATGMLLTLAVMARPRLFWPLMIVATTATGGMFVLGFPIFDEWLAGCIVLGALLAVLQGVVPVRSENPRAPAVIVFLLFAGYALMQATIGALAHNPKAIRFVLLYGTVLLTALLVATHRFPMPSARTISLLVAGSGCVYFALYVIHGLVFSDFLALLVFAEMEGIGGAGTAYAAFPAVVAVPAAMLVLRDESGVRRFLAIVTLGFAITAALLSQSRAAVLALAAYSVAAPFILGLKTSARALAAVVVVGCIVLVALGLDVEYLGAQYDAIVGALELSGGARVVKSDAGTGEFAKGDAQRHLMSAAALLTVYARPIAGFWGTGSYGYWSTAGPSVEALREYYGVPGYAVSGALFGRDSESEPPRPPSWPALIVEFGVVGVGLLTITIVLVAIRILKRPHTLVAAPSSFSSRYLVLLSLPLIIAWGYVGEIQDFILMYMMLMPFGVFDGWSDLVLEPGVPAPGVAASATA